MAIIYPYIHPSAIVSIVYNTAVQCIVYAKPTDLSVDLSVGYICQVKNCFSIHDVSVIEHLTGVAADDPDPWLEVEAVVVDESNFLSGQHWRRLQLVVTCPATGKVYSSSSPVTTTTRSSSSSSSCSPGNNNSRLSGRYSSRTTTSSILQDFTSWLLHSSSPPSSTKLLDSSSSPPSSTKLHTKRIITLSPSHSPSYIPVVKAPVAANSLIATSALLADEDDEDAAAVGVKNTHLRLSGHPPSLRKGQTASSMSECSNDSSLTLNSMRQALESNPNTVAEGVEGDVLVRDDGSDAISDEEEDDDDDASDDNGDNDDDDDEEEEEGRQIQQQELKGMVARDACHAGTPHISCSSLFLSGGRDLHNRRLSSTVCNVETEMDMEMEMEEIYTTGD